MRREREGRGSTVAQLEWRVRFAGAGAILAMVGIFFQSRAMIWVALAVLVAGFALRFVGRPDAGDGEDGDGEDDPPA